MNSRTGYWLTIIVTTLCLLLVIGAGMTYLQAFSNDVYVRGKTSFPSESVAQSQERGAFKYAFSASPAIIEANGKAYPISEVWLEQRMQPVFKHVWLKHWEAQEGEQLVLSAMDLPYSVAAVVDGQHTPLQHQNRSGVALMSGTVSESDTVNGSHTAEPVRLRLYKTHAGVVDKEAALGEILLTPIR